MLAASDADWDQFCAGCYRRGIVRKLQQEELIRDSCGNVLGSGFSGVGTGKMLQVDWCPEKIEMLRSGFNLPPSNELQNQIE